MEKIMSILLPHHHTPHHSTPQSSVSVCMDPLATTGMDIFSPSPDLLSPQHPYPTHSNFPSFSAPSLSAPPGPSCASSAMPPPPPPPPPPPTQQKLKPPHVVIECHKHQLFPGSIGQVATKLAVECVFGDDVLATTGTTEEGLKHSQVCIYMYMHFVQCTYMYMYILHVYACMCVQITYPSIQIAEAGYK